MDLDKKWRHFKLADISNDGDALFIVRKGKRLTSEGQVDGETPYIGATANNNGITNYIGQPAIHEGNTISLSYNGSIGEAFYQPIPFWATDDVNVLYFKAGTHLFNKYIGHFICAILRDERYKFLYSGRKWNTEEMCRTRIYLPIDTNGNPDWDWIERYMKSLESDLDAQIDDIMKIADGDKNIIKIFANKVDIGEFKAWLEENANMNADNQMSLDDKKWKQFSLSDFFDVERGERLKKSNRKIGEVPLITAGKDNSGVGGFVSDAPNKEYCNRITLDMFGNPFFHSETFVCDDNILVLIERVNLSDLAKKFIVTMLTQDLFKRGFSRQYRQKDFIVHKIYLPIDTNGNPDWDWIERYMKSLPYSDKKQIRV